MLPPPAVHVREGGAGGEDARRGAEPARLALGRRDGRQRARRLHRERSRVGERGGGRRRSAPRHGPRQVGTGSVGKRRRIRPSHFEALVLSYLGKWVLSLSEGTAASTAVPAVLENKSFLAQELELCQELGARERYRALKQNLSRKSSNGFPLYKVLV